MNKPLYSILASTVGAYRNCLAKDNLDWLKKHRQKCWDLCEELPSGSGIDCGTKIDLDASTDEKLVFDVAYHHMNDSGMYNGWTEHRVIVTASLWSGINIKITGRDRNGIKEYLHETYHHALTQELEYV